MGVSTKITTAEAIRNYVEGGERRFLFTQYEVAIVNGKPKKYVHIKTQLLKTQLNGDKGFFVAQKDGKSLAYLPYQSLNVFGDDYVGMIYTTRAPAFSHFWKKAEGNILITNLLYYTKD